GRRVSGGSNEMNRLYAAESGPSITGAMAEHRLPIRSSEIEALAARLLTRLQGNANAKDEPWLEAAASDLLAHRGSSLVVVGDDQAPEAHALGHEINELLGNFGQTVTFTEAIVHEAGTLKDLASDLDAGKVDALFILGGNPAFAAPADLEFSARVGKARFSAHLTVDANETSAACQWLIPETHFLESWSDARAFDGTLSIIQPLIDPLYNGISAHEFIAALLDQTGQTSYDIVRAHWNGTGEEWRKAVHDGVAARTQFPTVEARRNRTTPSPPPVSTHQTALEAVFKPDPALWDGRYANNGWLQELGRPITKVTWENPALISPALAKRLSLENGDIVEAKASGRTARLPVWITPGVAENCVILHTGNGRSRVGKVGTDMGTNV